MANIGTFTAQNDSFTGTVRTLTLNVKVKFIPNAKESENAPDYRIVAGNFEIGAAWKKISKAERPYLSATLDDTSEKASWLRPRAFLTVLSAAGNEFFVVIKSFHAKRR
jgi:uncharacterized protein (DUF736 family)